MDDLTALTTPTAMTLPSVDELGGFTLLLAQDGAGPPGASSAGAPATGQPGGNGEGGNGGAPGGAADPFSGMLPIFMIFIVFVLFVSIMGPRREKKRREALMNSLNKHDRVQTIGGVVGSIVDLKPDFVTLKVDESSNTRITVARSAIAQVLESRGSKKSDADASGS